MIILIHDLQTRLLIMTINDDINIVDLIDDMLINVNDVSVISMLRIGDQTKDSGQDMIISDSFRKAETKET